MCALERHCIWSFEQGDKETNPSEPVWNFVKKKKKKQIGINHTQEGIGCSLQGRLRAKNRRGGGGGKARNTGAQERNHSIAITQNQSSTV
jgi:hypothetical protein